MRRHRYVIGGLTLALALCLTACGVGERQNPTASDEETGSTHVAQAEDQKPATYTTKSGDTLLGVAARPEVYDDPGLWPLIKDANRESLEDKSADTKLAADLVLDIPRNASPEAVDAARSRARAWAARMKSGEPAQASASSRHARGSTADADDSGLEPDAPVGTAHEAPSVERKSQVSGQSAANQAAEAAAPAPAPAGGGHGSRILPLFFLLLLVLAALGAVLYVFSRRDRQDLD